MLFQNMKIKEKNYYSENFKIDQSTWIKSMITMLGIWNSKKMIKLENKLIYKCRDKEFNNYKQNKTTYIKENIDYMFCNK